MDVVKKNHSKKTLVVFLVMSISILFFISQEEIVEVGSIKYWYYLLPALILPLFNFQSIVSAIFYKTWPILLMVILVFSWSLFNDQTGVLLRLGLLLLMISWLKLNDTTIKIKTLSFLYIATIFFAILLYNFYDVNNWGIIPGTTVQEYGIWRISLFPNIANTAFISLFIFMVCTKDKKTYAENKLLVYLSLYFLIFSFVRTAIISLLVYVILYFFFKKLVNSKKMLFLISLIVSIAINILIAYSVEIIEALQSLPLIDRLLLRGEHSLSHRDIYVQMYRPWVWGQQWNIFINSPFFMGEGLYNFNTLRTSDLRGAAFEENDSVSLLLGMLAEYGLPTLFFYSFILFSHYKNAVNLDKWACSVFPIIIFICMQWGSIFHPASVMFVLYFLVLLRGQKGFV